MAFVNPIPDNISKFTNVYDVLEERGFTAQCTNPEAVRKLLGEEKIKFYIGFDPTADCLHVGHMIQVIVFLYMLKYGHTPVALIGGGTGMVGDPSGRSDIRRIMTVEEIDNNCMQFKNLFDRFLPFDEEWKYVGNEGVYVPGHETKTPEPGCCVHVNNAHWLRPLNYVDFVREVGSKFNVKEMLRAECFKKRAEEGGLSFFEFNYMLMQGYDFYVMARDFGLKMQFGGNDQWSNIIAGIDMARKLDNIEVYGLTTNLLTKADGQKMGKTASGALWLDESRVSVYDFFQYWRNIDDADVNMVLRMLTFLPMDEVNRLSALEGSAINEAKEIAAYEITKFIHGEEKAKQALEASRAVFAGAGVSENMPSTKMDKAQFEGEGFGLAALMKEVGLEPSTSEAFRTIQGGGARVNGEQITDKKFAVTLDNFEDGVCILQKGKKKFHKIEL
ncbi:MAG: tyrosine--tRNA ligase [Clostridiales bacterium]|nr:tyrosine--tRNA ligase [Candidatus Crickella merdequi]